MPLSRRVFLGVIVPIASALPRPGAWRQGLDQFAVSSPPCTPDVKPTPAVPRDASFKPGAPLRTSLIEPGMPGTRLTVTGTVAGLTCGRIGGADLEFWQADSRGVYDRAGFRLRGRQRTDADGRYRLVTIVPAAPPGRAPHLAVHVRVAGKAELWTELFFPDDPRNSRDARFRPELLLKLTRADDGQAAMFDIMLENLAETLIRIALRPSGRGSLP